MKIKGKKKKNTSLKEKKEIDTNKKRHKHKKNEKKKLKIWKILLTLFIIGCVFVVFSVFAFCTYIVVTTGEFDPTALANKDRTIIYDINGTEYATLGMENRESVGYDKLPEVLVDAIIATEDSRFFQHNGVDTARFLKASVQQLLGDSSAGGASTLTMQVVKNNLTNTTNTGIEGIIRKFRDVYLSVFFMEKNYTKKEILEFYVNDSSLGGGTYGVEEASKYYFGKSVSELTLPEAALIAGLFQAPNGYNPYRNPEAATKRRSTVLKLMVKHGYITQDEANVANSIDVESMLIGVNAKDSKYQAYIDTVVDEVQKKTEQSPYLVPMKIYTNLNPSIQDGISNIMSGNTSDYTWVDDQVQAGVTVLDVKTGAIVAVGGGRNRNGERQWNYATQTKRQPGSTAKPLFAYGPGFEYNNFSTYELFNDESWSYSDGTPIGNWDGGFEGLITLKRAVAVSRNIPAVKAFQQVGSKNVVKFVQSLGIDINDVAFEAYALGGLDPGVTTVDMAGAYAAFANGGYYTEPYTVSKIVYRESGEEVDLIPETNRAIKESTAYLVTNVLEYAANYGFSGGTSRYAGTVAVKTGTSNYTESILDEYNLPYNTVKDLWSVAYTPEYSISLWYGYDELSSKYYSTLSYPKDDLMAAVMKYIPVCTDAFEVPSSVVASEVEFGTWPAQLPISGVTPDDLIRTEYFVKGTQPTETSNRFAKFSDVTNLKSTAKDSTITLTWKAEEPEIVTEEYLKEYFNQSVFGNGSSNFLSERLNYNSSVLGGFGYGIYVKQSNGNLKQVGFTTSNTYTYKSTATGTITMVVKAQYKSFTKNASDGATTKVVVSDTVVNNDSFEVKLNGLNSVVVDENTKYEEMGIIVLKNGNDISGQCSSVGIMCKIDYSIVSSTGNTSATNEEDLEEKINNMPTGIYTIKYVVKFNDKRTTVERTVEVK